MAKGAHDVRRVLLVGNPNVGKSVLFKNLTQRYVTVSNYPGTTVEVVRAQAELNGSSCEVLDTPGVNDLSQPGDEARVTREILDLHPDATVVQVADAKNLRRALLLSLQLAELKRPAVLVLNMMDELGRRGGRVDTARLSEALGVPVVETTAIRQQGTRELIDTLRHARPSRLDGERFRRIESPYERNRARLARVNEIMAGIWSIEQPRRAPFGVRLGFWAMHPIKGLAMLAAVLFLVFWFVGLFGAGTLVDGLEVAGFQQHVHPWLIRGVDRVLPFPHQHVVETIPYTMSLPLTPVHELELGHWERTVLTPAYVPAGETPLSPLGRLLRFLHDLLVGEYGLITMGLSYALAIVLPIVTTFFVFFSLLEDSGYMPRMAILLNRVFRLMGLNGKAVLPMVLGLGCDTMATMTTRILETRKERIVTTVLLALAVPCSAQLGVLMAMMAGISGPAVAIWVGLMIAVVLTVGWLTARLLGGESSPLILEIPPMRRPMLQNVAIKTWARLRWYMREVIPLFLIGTAVLFLLDRIGALGRIAAAGRPLVTGWLGLPAEMANAFLIGFLRRDFGAVYLLDASIGPDAVLTSHQVFVAMVTITLFMPCFATFLMIAKEHGQKVAWAITLFVFPFAFLVGGLIHRIGLWIGV